MVAHMGGINSSVGLGMGGPVATGRVAQISESLNGVDESVAGIQDRVSALFNRLESVMRPPEPPTPEKPGLNQVVESKAMLASRIDGQRVQIQSIIHQLDNILNRLEI